MLINLVGVRYGAWSVNIFTLGKLVPLGVFAVGVGILSSSGKEPHTTQLGLNRSFWRGRSPHLFAFGGFENLTIPAEEAAQPQRDIPKALLATMTLVIITYVSIQIVAIGTFADLAESKTPLASACAEFLGPLGGTLITWGALVSTTGTLSGLMLTGPRLTYALAQRGQLPALFGKVHSRFHTPIFSILFYGAVSWGLTLSGTFIQLAGLSAIARLLQYMATCLALLRLRKMNSANEGYFQIPFARVAPTSGFVMPLATFQSSFSQLLLSAGAVLLGCLFIFRIFSAQTEGQRFLLSLDLRSHAGLQPSSISNKLTVCPITRWHGTTIGNRIGPIGASNGTGCLGGLPNPGPAPA